MFKRKPSLLKASALLLLFVSFFLATSSDQNVTVASNESSISTDEVINFNCPEDCHCVKAKNTHKPLLHAKCSSLKGLKSEEPLNATLPIHSMDLSYLNLVRLSHALDKLPDLTSVDLSHNELHEFGHLGRRIKKLNLKHNRITSNKLTKLPQHVQVLNLQHNDITYLPLEMKKLNNLHTLELSHNQINCSCETLEVRNWLQSRNIYMEHPVKCGYPREYKGMSWLQIKQSEVCEKEKRGWHPDEEENELMLGDQPFEGSAELDEEEEFGKAYIPIEKKTASKSNEVQLSDVEGSGDLDESHLPMDMLRMSTEKPENITKQQEDNDMNNDEEAEEGSGGSGGGILNIDLYHANHFNADDFESDLNENKNDDSKPIDEPVYESAQDVFEKHMSWHPQNNKPKELEQQPSEATETAQNIFDRHMGIYEGSELERDNTENSVPAESDNGDSILPVVHHSDDSEDNAENVEISTDGVSDADNEEIKQANMGEDDGNAIYFLLGVIAVIVLGLLLYVAIKRCKYSNAHRHDIENARQTELLNMDKKNPGKPLRNGNEHLPLITEKNKAEIAKPLNGTGMKPYDGSDVKDGANQEPLMNGNNSKNGGAPNDQDTRATSPIQNEAQPHEYYPISPRYPRPQSPRASKYAQYPQSEPNNNEPDNSYLPASPKSGRYSPVYSPETGRVKIKLTETPRPKTPMLVTRSKSNAGDIITTPVRQEQVHGPGTNGQLVH